MAVNGTTGEVDDLFPKVNGLPASNYCPVTNELVRMVVKDYIQELFESYWESKDCRDDFGLVYLSRDANGPNFFHYRINGHRRKWFGFKTLVFELGHVRLYHNDDETIRLIKITGHGNPVKFESLARWLKGIFSSVEVSIEYNANRAFKVKET